MSFPKTLKYSKDHEWLASEDGSSATVGVTDYAIEQLGDVVHIELPQPGEEYDQGSSFGTIESTKTVSDLYAPVSGKVVEVNENIHENLEALGDDPYDEGWLIKMSVSSEDELNELLDHKGYEEFIADQEG